MCLAIRLQGLWCRGRTRTTDLMPVCRTNPTSGCALPMSYTTHHIYLYPSYKQLAATPAYDIRRRAHPHYWTCNQDSVFNSFCMLRLCRNHSAFNSHNFPRTMVLMVHATTFQPYCSHRDLTRRSSLVRKLPASDCCTRGPLSCRLFPLALQPGLFRCRFSSWFCTTLSDYSPPLLPLCFSIFSLLAGISLLHVPRRSWKVAESNRLLT